MGTSSRVATSQSQKYLDNDTVQLCIGNGVPARNPNVLPYSSPPRGDRSRDLPPP